MIILGKDGDFLELIADFETSLFSTTGPNRPVSDNASELKPPTQWLPVVKATVMSCLV